jgi:hypothetical protein
MEAMRGKKSSGPKISAKATAKFEAVAKATYQRRKTTTEVVPPDVSRAKARAWLTLLSPITEWAGLKGDALNFQRRLLRIQQEETLLRVAESVRRKLADKEILKPVPRKILVPALEKASLEDSEDQNMIDLWANLLASAAQAVTVQPRFVGILEELAGTQAKCLERLLFNKVAELKFPAAELDDSSLDFAGYIISELFEQAVGIVLEGGNDPDSALDLIVETFSKPGVLLELATIVDLRKDIWWTFDVVAETGIRDDEDLSILESLGLIRYEVITFTVPVGEEKITYEVSAHYYHLTRLGLEFSKVCLKPRIDELEKVDAISRQKNLTRKRPFQLA